MRWTFAILLILLGSFLISLTISDMGDAGHIILKTIGIGLFLFAALIVRTEKEKNKTL